MPFKSFIVFCYRVMACAKQLVLSLTIYGVMTCTIAPFKSYVSDKVFESWPVLSIVCCHCIYIVKCRVFCTFWGIVVFKLLPNHKTCVFTMSLFLHLNCYRRFYETQCNLLCLHLNWYYALWWIFSVFKYIILYKRDIIIRLIIFTMKHYYNNYNT